MICREADNKILELQKSGSPEILEWIKKKTAYDKLRARLNDKLKRTGVK